MRAQHTTHNIPAFPIYSSAFLSPEKFVLGGGGGSSKSGIKNKLKLFKVGEQRNIELVDELELQVGEDAPMSMSADITSSTLVCGINSSEDLMLQGKNENCRVFSAKDDKLSLLQARGTLISADIEDYQKVTVISPDCTMVAIAGSHSLDLLSYPSLAPLAATIQTEKEIYDATFSATTLVIATVTNLLVYALPTLPPSSTQRKKKGKAKSSASKLQLLKTADIPSVIGGSTGGTFRSAKYNPVDNQIFYTCINSTPSRSRGSKMATRKAFICRWDTTSWTVIQVRKVGDRGLTCFTISADGKLLAFGNSDLMVGMLDSRTLSPVLTILKSHEFPPTTIAFNPTSQMLVSGSADSLRVITVPDTLGGWSWTFIVILTILVVVLALVAQGYVDRSLFA